MTADEITFLDESNKIEGVYDADSLQQAQYAWEYLKKQKKLDRSVVLKTHKILMLHQHLKPDEKGYFRKVDVMIAGRFGLTPFMIPQAMDQWIINANDLIKNGKKETPEFLERMIQEQHVKYERIHPHIDGNGRLGRCLMNWQRINSELPILIIKADERQKYYQWFV